MSRAEEIEVALSASPQVREAVVLARRDRAGDARLVAYVVPEGPFDPERLRAHLPQGTGQISFVPLASMPLAANGEVDEQALARIGVIDSDLVRECEDRLRSMPGIDQVAVVVEETVEPVPSLHLSDLLPGWKSASMRDGSGPQSVQGHAESTPRSSGSAEPAISHGGDLRQDADAPATLSQALKRAARISQKKGVVYIEPDGSEIFQSYPDLVEDAERILAGLRKLGLKPQDKVIFQLERNQDFIPAYWACQLGGFVPVPVSIAPSYSSLSGGAGKLHSAWQMLDRPLTLADGALAPAIRSLSDQLDMGDIQLAVIDDLRRCLPDHAWREGKPDELCLLLLTSGSTGVPKAVALSHRNIVSFSAGTAQMNSFTGSDVSLNWLPIDHVGAISFLHSMCVYLGCQQVHAQKEVVLQDPLKWLDWMARHRATITWAPNFAFGLINDRADEIEKRAWNLSSMRFLVNAGEAIVPRTARQFLKLLSRHGLPATSIHPAFGMSETSSGITWSDGFSLDAVSDDDSFVELGPPIPGAALRIADENNEPVEGDVVGRLQVRGESVTSGYYRNPGLNEEAFTTDGWFKTGDLGFLRGGRLTITGREKDVIIVNGVNYHGHEIEAVVEEVPGVVVSFTAACAVRVSGTDTDRLAVFFHASSDDDVLLAELLKVIRGAVVRKIGLNPDYLIPIGPADIPKTAIGKIQRTQLSQRFRNGEFDPIVKRVDILSGNANTLPAWFYRKYWRRKQRVGFENSSGAQSVLVFLDRSGLGASLRNELDRLNWPSVGVEAGADFAKLASDRYRIDPRNSEHYRRLLASVTADGLGITQIAHLWTYGAGVSVVTDAAEMEQAQDSGVFSLLFLVQALAKRQGNAQPVRLNVISSLVQHVLPEDEIAYQNGPLLGFVRTIPQEMPWLDCRHVDLAIGDNGSNAVRVVGEIRASGRDREVAYRQGERWIPRLQRMEVVGREGRELPFRRGGMYLVSGGLGGIGVEIARYLLEEFQAKLLLVGRTPLALKDVATETGASGAAMERIKIYRELEDLPGEVCYESVDICDLPALRQTVEASERRWRCELDGVIHLAGTYHERPLVEETRDSFARVLRPKVLGTLTLAQLLGVASDKLFISFSSANSSLGGALVGAYSAANTFLESFAHHQRRRQAARSYCFEWSMWDELGMSRGFQMKELTRKRGYCIIPANQGIFSLLSALRSDEAHAVIGLDGGNEHVRTHVDNAPHPTQKLCAYFTPKATEASRDRSSELATGDRFGARIECEFRQVSQFPLTDSGAIDRDKLARLHQRRDQRVTDLVAPRTEVERRIAGFWREVLAAPQFGVHDSLFDLGGNSLLATQIASRIHDAYGVQLPLRTMLEESTVAKLALVVQRHLDQGQVKGGEAVERIETTDAKSILARIDQLSDEEVSKLLSQTLAEGEAR